MTLPAPRVTVITATFNSAASLRMSLASLAAQDYTDFDAWVIGDACTDDSDAVVASLKDPRVRWVNLPANSGSQAGPNNAGLDRATGEFVAYLGHDDLWFPWHLGDLVAGLDRSRADLAHGLVAVIDRNGPFAAIGGPPAGVTYRDHFVPPSAWMHRRSAGWSRWSDPAALAWPVDTDVLRRAAAAGARFACEPRLSVLKFPSMFFRAYAPGSDRPQTSFLADLQRDPAALERRVLTDLAVYSAHYPLQYLARTETSGQLVRRSLWQSIRRRTLDPIRGTRAIAPILRAIYQHRRRRLRSTRGLPE